MPISIHLDENTLQELNNVVEETGKSRSSIIRESVAQWLIKRRSVNWKTVLDDLAGAFPDFEGFESGREDLLPPDEDPLEL